MFEVIKVEQPHTCLYSTMNLDHKNLGSRLVGRDVMPMIAKNPAMNIAAIMAYVKEKYNYTISYKKAWNAK